MKKKRRPGLYLLAWLFMALFVACGRQAGEPDSPVPAPAADVGDVAQPLVQATAQAPAGLPPPLVVTLPAGAPELTLGGGGTMSQEVVVQAAGTDGPLPEELQQLLAGLQGGVFRPEARLEVVAGGQPTTVYADINGDGVEDEIIILVIDQATYDAFYAAASQGSPVPSLVPLPLNDGVLVRALDVQQGQILAELVSLNEERGGARQLIYAVNATP